MLHTEISLRTQCVTEHYRQKRNLTSFYLHACRNLPHRLSRRFMFHQNTELIPDVSYNYTSIASSIVANTNTQGGPWIRW